MRDEPLEEKDHQATYLVSSQTRSVGENCQVDPVANLGNRTDMAPKESASNQLPIGSPF